MGEGTVQKLRAKQMIGAQQLGSIGSACEWKIDELQNSGVVSKHDEWQGVVIQGCLIVGISINKCAALIDDGDGALCLIRFFGN